MIGDSGADGEAADAAGEHTAPVAVETEIVSTQQDVACGRVDPGHCIQETTVLAAPLHLMRKRRRRLNGGITLEHTFRQHTSAIMQHTTI